MATLSEILSRKWPDADLFINGDDYSTLQWFSDGEPPTEAEIREHSDEVDREFRRYRMRVTPLQFRRALDNAGLLDACDALVNHEDTPRSVRLSWEYATMIERTNPFIDQFAAALDKTPEKVDAIFEATAQI